MLIKRKKKRKLEYGPGITMAVRKYAGEHELSEGHIFKLLRSKNLKFINGELRAKGEPARKEQVQEKLRRLVFAELEKMLFDIALDLAPIVVDIIKEAALESKRTGDYIELLRENKGPGQDRLAFYEMKYKATMARRRTKMNISK
jgi:hypothetical protein